MSAQAANRTDNSKESVRRYPRLEPGPRPVAHLPPQHLFPRTPGSETPPVRGRVESVVKLEAAGEVVPSDVCTLTTQYVDSSANYQSLRLTTTASRRWRKSNSSFGTDLGGFRVLMISSVIGHLAAT
jgi:hypothetical protein